MIWYMNNMTEYWGSSIISTKKFDNDRNCYEKKRLLIKIDTLMQIFEKWIIDVSRLSRNILKVNTVNLKRSEYR